MKLGLFMMPVHPLQRDPPYDIDLPDNRFKVTTAKTLVSDIGKGVMYRPYQKPRPEIVGTVVAPNSKGVIAMGERDFHPLSANFLLPHWLPSHWANYSEGRRRAGKTADPADWRIARTIFVADDEKVAERYGKRDAASPYRFYWQQLRVKLTISRRHIVFKTHEGQDDAELTDDYVLDRLVICGTVNKVVDEDPEVSRAGRRLRRACLCRDGLGGPEAREALDGSDGDRGDAPRRQGDRRLDAAATRRRPRDEG